jgi:hypothetical protein
VKMQCGIEHSYSTLPRCTWFARKPAIVILDHHLVEK